VTPLKSPPRRPRLAEPARKQDRLWTLPTPAGAGGRTPLHPTEFYWQSRHESCNLPSFVLRDAGRDQHHS